MNVKADFPITVTPRPGPWDHLVFNSPRVEAPRVRTKPVDVFSAKSSVAESICAAPAQSVCAFFGVSSAISA